MAKFIVRRFLWMLLVLFVVSLITFGLMNAIPGGPFDSAGERPLPPEIIANIEARYGLDDPIWFRYVNYIGAVAFPKITYGEWQHKLTLDREQAGLPPLTDEAGDEIKLAVPRNVLTSFTQPSVVDDFILNIDTPFRRDVPVNVRDVGNGGGEIIGTLAPNTAVRVLRANNRGDYYQIEAETPFSNGETVGWVINDRLRFDGTPTPESPLEATLLGAPMSFRWFNFGPSYTSRSQTVNDLFENQLGVSAQLGLAALAVSIVIGIPLGIVAGLNRNTRWDYTSMGVAVLGVSFPVIVLGPFLRYLAGLSNGVLPISGWESWRHYLLPSFALGFAQAALLARLTRASILQVLNEDYVRTARAKGLSERSVVFVHVLKNSMIPVVTVIGPLFAALVTGSFVTEQVFSIPGIGRYFVTSVSNRDYPVIMGTILLYAFFLVVANMVVDILYALLDPRIRFD